MTNVSKDQTQEQNGSGFAGTLRNIQLNDIIQMCCLAGASLCVRVSQDQDQGMIYIQEGEVVHAECAQMAGVEAFFTILGWQSGQFETLDADAVDTPTIKEACQFLLMEAARRADELVQTQAQPEAEQEVVEAQKLRVLIVDDSPIMAKILNSMLEADPFIDVVGSAKNGEVALTMMEELSPDLITMDVNMPVMDGSTALKHIMIKSPCPVLIMSNLSPASYSTILTFLNLGAVDFMSKPVKNRNIIRQQQRMVDRVHLAATANVKRFQRLRHPKLKPSDLEQVNESIPCEKFVIVNSGAGGYLEIVNLITALPAASKASVLSLQSIPPPFAPMLAEYLNARSRFQVQSLIQSVPLCPGRCYIGASGAPLEMSIEGPVYRLQKSGVEEERDNFDHLLSKAAELLHDRVVVVLLSGAELGTMEGLRKIKAAGGEILAPELSKCILPLALEPAADEALIKRMFDPAELVDILVHYCT